MKNKKGKIALLVISTFCVMAFILYPLTIRYLGQFYVTEINWRLLFISAFLTSLISIVILGWIIIKNWDKRLGLSNLIASLLLVGIIVLLFFAALKPSFENIMKGPSEYRGSCSLRQSPRYNHSLFMSLITRRKYDNYYNYYLTFTDGESAGTRLLLTSQQFESFRGEERSRFYYSCSGDFVVEYFPGMNYVLSWEEL